MNKTFGAALLIAGCIIGTGMLGMPVITGQAGFGPACFYFVLAWGFMVLTGLLLARVTLSFPKKEINLISMTRETLGKPGEYSTFILFSLLFYALLIAYSIAGGRLVADFGTLFGFECSFSAAALGLQALFYGALVLGLRSVDLINRCLMGGLSIAYICLIACGVPHMEITRLERADWIAGLSSLPVLIIAFGYHNLIPTLVHYLNKDEARLKKAIILGSFLPLVIYLIWEAMILGLIPFTEKSEWMTARGQGHMITDLLSQVTHSDGVIYAARLFAFFAIATSFLPVAFSFLDFMRDATGVKESTKSRALLGFLVLAPPLVVALTKPHLFLVALNYAGGFCTVMLFGLLPCLMALKKKIGSRPSVIGLAILSCAVLVSTLLHELGVIS